MSKYKIGDKVYLEGKISEYDENDNTYHVDYGGYTAKELEEMFRTIFPDEVFADFTPQESLAKVKAYEEERNEIKVGDVIRLKGTGNESIISLTVLFNSWKSITTRRQSENYVICQVLRVHQRYICTFKS